MDITLQSIGTIHTPYFAFNTPHQPIPDANGDFWITLDSDYIGALKTLEAFDYIYILYYLDQVTQPINLLTRSPWAPDMEIGLFASRSPARPNPIGLSIVQLKAIQGNELTISGIDAYNGTPVLDIKPYMGFLDSKTDANNGWFDALPDKEHTIAHAFGLSHDHGEDPHHDYEHAISHSHNHDPNQVSDHQEHDCRGDHGHDHHHDHHDHHDHHNHTSQEESLNRHHHDSKGTKPLQDHND